MKINLVDPDTYVNWLRTDEPGEHPRWESKCGVIIQTIIGGTSSEYRGYHWPDSQSKVYNEHVAPVEFTTFASAKRKIERAYFSLHPTENVPAY